MFFFQLRARMNGQKPQSINTIYQNLLLLLVVTVCCVNLCIVLVLYKPKGSNDKNEYSWCHKKPIDSRHVQDETRVINDVHG